MKAARTRVPRRAAAAILTTAMLTGCSGDGSPQPPAAIDKPAVDRVPTRVHQLIVEQLGADEAEVSLDAHLRDDLGADSLDMVELTMALEEEFGGEIADAESATFVRVRDIVEHLRKQGVLN